MNILSEEMMKELVPKIGHRAKLKANIDEWKKVLDLTSSQITIMDISSPLSIDFESPSTSSLASVEGLTDTPSDTEISFTSSNNQTLNVSNSNAINNQHSNLSLIRQSSESVQNLVLNYLNNSIEGKGILFKYRESGVLDNLGRRKLCNLIVRKELENEPDKIVTSQKLLLLSQEITSIFPKEHISTYFIPYMSYVKKATKGKLLDCFNNRRREFKKAGVITHHSRGTTTIEPNFLNLNTLVNSDIENVEEPIKWLNNSSDPWDIVEKYWDFTKSYRLRNVLNSVIQTVSQYMNEFPALK
uniref:Uncharacterized protein n=1 Tax=Schizaphis graminum TaxID=13262 RepID=A0A2S2NSH2_SCHGA